MTDTSPVWEYVRGIEPVSFCDWPGKVSAVLFTGGCNFRCPTCHNGSLAWHWERHPALPREETLADLQRRKRWLDGLTLSGGEPTCVPDLVALLADLAMVGLPLKLDSNGSSPEILERVLSEKWAQTVAVDVKGPWRLYPDLTGGVMAADAAKDALTRVFALAEKYPGQVYFRCTKVPLLGDAELQETRKQVPEDLSLTFQEFVPPRKMDDV